MKRTVSGILLMLLLIGTFMLAFGVRPTLVHAMPLAVRDGKSMGLDDLSIEPYDEQLGLCFTQNFSSLTYNVTAVQQNDSNGWGPAYLLNGVTDQGYWYQVGLSYDWPNTDGTYAAGFNFFYEVWNNSGCSIFPADGGGGLDSFNGTVNDSDNLLLNLYLSNGNVTMYANDWNTNASAQETYTAAGASLFHGAIQSPFQPWPWYYFDGNGYFTGLMTEWYHLNPYYGGEALVVYDEASFALQMGHLWAREFAYSNGTDLFNDGQSVLFNHDPTQLQNFTTNGAAEAASGYQFITGEPTVNISPDSIIMDVGQSQVFTASVVGGVSPYTYQWYLDGAVVSGATDADWMYTPTSTGSYTIYVNVIDSVGAQATSNSADVTVNIHDVAVTSVSSSKTVVGQNFGLNISVTVVDLGTYTETLNVTVYANTTYVTSENVTLQSDTYANVTLTWNPTGFAYGNYTISAYAWPVPGETNTANNNCTGCWVFVSIVSDVNGDGQVNMKDVAAVARAFGSTPGSSNWNPNADINSDGTVNMRDVALVARHFGQHYP